MNVFHRSHIRERLPTRKIHSNLPDRRRERRNLCSRGADADHDQEHVEWWKMVDIPQRRLLLLYRSFADFSLVLLVHSWWGWLKLLKAISMIDVVWTCCGIATGKSFAVDFKLRSVAYSLTVTWFCIIKSRFEWTMESHLTCYRKSYSSCCKSR